MRYLYDDHPYPWGFLVSDQLVFGLCAFARLSSRSSWPPWSSARDECGSEIGPVTLSACLLTDI